MRMINLGFGRYTEANLLIVAQAILAAITAHSDFFPTPIPTLAVFQTGINNYSDALTAAKDGGKTAIAIKNARKAELIALLVQLGNYVTLTANGDEEQLSSSAFPLRKSNEPMPPLVKPEIGRIEDGVNSGELQATIGAVPGARTYVYQYTQDPLTADSQWTSSNSTLTKILFTGLEPGKKYWTRVIAYGKNEQEVYSDAVLSPMVR